MKASPRILVVHGSLAVAERLAGVLASAGHQVTTASVVADALQQARVAKPDLVLVDGALAHAKEADLCQRLKNAAEQAFVCIMLLSSKDQGSGIRPGARPSGADDYVVGPIADEDLLARVQGMLRVKLAEETLRKERDSAWRYLESAGTAIVVVAANGRITLANRKCCEMLGCARDELMTREWKKVFGHTVAGRATASGFIGEMVDGRVPEDTAGADVAVWVRDGEERSIAWRYVLVRDEAGGIAGAICTGEDVTEYSRATVALELSEARHRRLFETAQEGILILDADTGQVTDVNPFLLDLVGYDRGDLLGKPLWEIGAFRAVVASRNAFVELRQAGYSRYEDLPLETRDGGRIEVELVSTPYLVGQQRLIQCNVRDVTARKRAEETLRQSEEKLRLVADFTHDWEYWLRPDGAISYVSPACERITGYVADEFAKDPGLLQRMVHPADADIFAGHLRDTLAPGAKPAELVYRIVTRAGEVRWIGHSCQAIYGSDGAWLGERASNRDITQRTEDLRQLHERTAQMEALRQVSLSLTAQLDLNTLLQSIISQAAALLQAKSGVLYLHRPDLDALEWVVGVGLTSSLSGSLLRRGEGLSGRVWQTGEPMMVADYQGWEGRASRYEGEAMGALVGVPVRWGDDFLGVINVVHDSPRAFSASDVEILTLFASVAAIALRNARALADEAAHRRRAEALGRATGAVASALGLDALLESLLGAALEATPAADGGGVLLWDGETRELVVRAAVGLRDAAVRQLRFAAGSPAPLWQAFEGEALLLTDVVAAMGQENPLVAAIGIRSAILAPLRYGGKGIGVLVVTCGKPMGGLTTGDLSLMTAMADQCAVAVENARLAADAQLKAILEERQRLARELHDSVTQSVYGLTLFTQATREWAAAGDLERVQGQLVRIAETAQQALKEMRLLVYELRPFGLQNEDIVSALNHRLDSVERRAGVDAHLWTDVEGRLPPIAEETLFRVAQESLANALKHAHAARVSLHLSARDGRAELEVVDDGVGFDTEAVRGQGGMGLTSMKERMEGVGGSLAVTSLPGKGTRVQAVMPIPGEPISPARNR